MRKLPGVSVANVNLASEKLTVTYDPAQLDERGIMARVERIGYGVPTTKIELPITGLRDNSDALALEKALSDFKSKISDAKTEHDQGSSVLNAHAGFDDTGKVTDKEQARTTLKQTREHLRGAHLDLREGTRTLRLVIRDFRKANKPAKTKPTTATQQP